MGPTFEAFLVCWRWRRSILLAGLVLVVGASSLSRGHANGGALRLSKAQAGPYLVSAWTQPDPPRVGRLHVSIAVMRSPTAEPVLDVEVGLRATAVEAEEATSATSLERGAGGNLLLYHGELEIPTAGPRRVTVMVNGPAGRGQATYEVVALPR